MLLRLQVQPGESGRCHAAHARESWKTMVAAGEALRAEYEGSVGKLLLPLLERIRQTDELIDAIVYRLYGLTEEAIRIVEGRH